LWIVIFVLSLKDVEAAVLLAPPGGDTLAVRVMTMLHYMPDAQVSALCLIQVALTAASVAVLVALVAAESRLRTFLARRSRA
jgi:ABC-type spermidine/putrescine transport system permease subunit II